MHPGAWLFKLTLKYLFNNPGKMNKLILCLLFLVTGLVASSQKVYFVYIQSEADQPFFVRVNQKANSSTGSGYLILPKLRDSSYNLSIGFPQNKWPEQNFSIAVNNKDHGYLLKNFGEKGWGLFDLQTLAVQMPTAGTVKTETVAKPENKDVSAFTDILSKAADDPSLKEKPVQPKVEEKKPESIPQEVVKKEEPKIEAKEPVVVKSVEIVEKPIVKKEEPKVEVKETVVTRPAEVIPQPVVKNEEPKVEAKETITTKPVEIAEKPIEKKEELKAEVKETVITKPVVKEEVKTIPIEEYKKSVIIKKSESSTTEGFGLVFFDDYQNGTKDTIRLLIPNSKPVVAVVKEEPKEEKKFLDITTEATKTEEKKTEVVELPVAKKEEPKIEVKEPAVAKPVTTEATVIKPVVKNNCTAMADESDFFKLRKNMAAAESDDEMISEANKNFKAKCFTVQQVKNLGALFLSDGGKYKFFDAAYTFVSDTENFSSLQAELKDEYYINRFKAMLRN